MTSLQTPPAPTLQQGHLHALALAETHAAPNPVTTGGIPAPPSSAPLSSTRVTVLPRVESEGEAVRLVRDDRARYEPIRQLGVGGMGEVILVHDQDIARPVAIKRLLPELDDAATLVRFVDEIRTIGQLEHPNIVPIHDVGVDDEGRYFFVMKYVEGETLAAIIDKLRTGDAEYHKRYTMERRIEIFRGVLHALDFAHSHGILHRDIKPANVMVGRYGEVVVMDWGIAKPMAAARDLAARALAEAAPAGVTGERMFATRVGSYVGTPSYMSPEQALGQNDTLDARSDLYSATVLFHELVTLQHYLGEQPSVEAMLAAVVGEEIGHRRLMTHRHPAQPGVPAELLHVVHRGLQKDPAGRYPSAAAMVEVLQIILEGKNEVQCHVTLIKRASREMGRFVDRHPQLAVLTWLAVAASVVATGVELVRAVL
jgi:eukaryotic-like serine/threonine-protein kinase